MNQDDGSPQSAELSRLGDQFVASLNHDIRTPLSGIMGMTDLLMETDLSEEQKEYVGTARLCANQLLEMLNSALEFAALSAGIVKLEKAEFHLPRTLHEVVREHRLKAESKGLRLSMEVAADVPEYVIGDEVRLRQAIYPLLANAVKFTHTGEVEVRAKLNGAVKGASVSLAVAVRDTGIGIADAHLRTIFESFHQLERGLSRSFAGMGLGLALANKLASIMGGEIAVESETGSGSTFSLTVPLEVPGRQLSGAEPGGHSSEDGRPRVLFVDDNEVARRIVAHILKRANYNIICADGGEEGIEAARQSRFDLVLMDLQMPNVNGLQATAAIRLLPGYRQTPILALTANYSEEFMRRCRDAGFQGFLSKPIQRDELLRELQRCLKLSPQA